MGLLTRPTSLIWLFLMAATIVTTWGLSKDNFDPQWATAGIILIAAYKVRLVLLHFMELNHAPLSLRLVFEVWTLVVTVGVLGFYFKPALVG